MMVSNRLRRYVNNWYLTKRLAAGKVLYCQIHLTERCQYSCEHCYFTDLGHKAKDMGKRDLNAVLSTIMSVSKRKHLYPRVDFTGGDPFLSGAFDYAMEMCHELGIVYGIKCNSDFLVSSNKEVLSERLKSCSSVSISIDGTEREHDAIRGRSGGFKNAIEAAHIVNDLGLFLRLNTTISKRNVDTVIPLLRYLSDEQIKVAAYTFARYWSPNYADCMLNSSDLIPLFNDCVLFLEDYLNRPQSYSNSDDELSVTPHINFAFKEHLWFPYLSENNVLDESTIRACCLTPDSICCSALTNAVVVDSDGQMYRCRKLPDLQLTSLGDATNALDISYLCDETLLCASCYYRNACCGCPAVDRYIDGEGERGRCAFYHP